MTDTPIITPRERRAIYITAQLEAFNQRLRDAIRSKDKRALLKIYDDMQACPLNMDLAADPVLEEHDTLVDQANAILYGY